MSSSAQLSNAVQGARAVAAQGDVRGAFALLDQAVDRAGAALGVDDPDVLAASGLLAKLHADLGELNDARRVLEEGLAAGYHRLGDGHAVMLGLAYELARVADELGNVFEAKRRYGQLVRLGPQALGEEHPSVRAARRYLGLAEHATPVHVPHTTAPAPFDPVSPPTAAGPQIWPADERTAPEPPVHAPPEEPWPVTGGALDSGTGWSEGQRSAWREEQDSGPAWPDVQASGPTSNGPPPSSGPPSSGPPTFYGPPPSSGPPSSGPPSSGAPAFYGPPPVSTPPASGPPPSSGPPFYEAPPASAPPSVPAMVSYGAPVSAAPWTEAADDPMWEEAPRRRSPLTALLVIVAVAVAGGAAAAAVSFIVARPDGSSQPQPSAAVTTAGAAVTAPAGGASGAAGGNPKAPAGLRLRDDRIAITLTWVDPSQGTVPFIVAGGQEGALRQLQVMPAGSTTYTINGLNPKLDYCFTVAAVYSTNSVELSDLACTNRS